MDYNVYLRDGRTMFVEGVEKIGNNSDLFIELRDKEDVLIAFVPVVSLVGVFPVNKN
jgi:hypothetical protein